MELYKDKATLEIEDELILKDRNKIREFFEFFFILKSHIHFSSFSLKDNTIICDMAESNDWLIKSGLGKGIYSVSFKFNNGLINYTKIKLSQETSKGFHKVFDVFVNWAKNERPQVLAETISEGKIYYSADNAKKLLLLLQEWLETKNEGKQIFRNDFESIMDVIGVKPGMIVADVGAGDGYYSFKLAERVGETGKIYANELNGKLLRKIKKICEENKIDNVITVNGGETDARLPRKDFDMIFLRHTLHCMSKPDDWLKNVRKYMEQNGILVIIDGDPDILGYGWKYENKREDVIRMAEQASFKLERLETFLFPEDYIYIFLLN